jgi:hypothetical protein
MLYQYNPTSNNQYSSSHLYLYLDRLYQYNPTRTMAIINIAAAIYISILIGSINITQQVISSSHLYLYLDRLYQYNPTSNQQQPSISLSDRLYQYNPTSNKQQPEPVEGGEEVSFPVSVRLRGFKKNR